MGLAGGTWDAFSAEPLWESWFAEGLDANRFAKEDEAMSLTPDHGDVVRPTRTDERRAGAPAHPLWRLARWLVIAALAAGLVRALWLLGRS